MAVWAKKNGDIISKNVEQQWQDPEKRKRILCSRGLRVLRDMFKERPELLDEDDMAVLMKEYDKRRFKTVVRFEKLLAEIGDLLTLKEAAVNYNTRVAAVNHISLEKPIKVYDISVEGTHNFMLTSGSGVIVKNSDADPDGSHICCLMITFFFKFMRSIIERGHLYVAIPPLFRIRHKGKVFYLKNDEELDAYREKHPGEDFEVTRFKGLGEMNGEQLAATVMNPATRVIQQITVEDAAQAAKTVEALMGTDIEGRKKFLFHELAMNGML